MKKIRVDSFCDFCMHEKDTYIPSTDTWTAGMERGDKQIKAYTIDCCAIHSKQLATLSEVLRILGVASTMAIRTDYRLSDTVCEICGAEFQLRSYSQHLYRSHGAQEPKQPKKCPDCDYKISEPLSMRQHRVKTHDYSVIPELLAQLKSK